KTHRLILPLAAVAMFASASVSNAAVVVYDLTVDTPAGFSATITIDTSIASDLQAGRYHYGTWDGHVSNGAISAFTLTLPGGAELDQTDEVEAFILFMDVSGAVDIPLGMGDIAVEDATNSISGWDLDFTDGNGGEIGGVSVTGAALTAQAIPEPGSLALLGLSGLALLRRRR
ncbi:MAG: PEP-CTERM sorting domain-containing protein, partial [Akkermansiaceae bacterium]|nr:PEP-CTERM sorting domain-containing protein [Akkermansiaceae bacterium]